MDIVIISQYLRDIENLEGNNSRFLYLANLLSKEEDTNVEIITSNFMHGPKQHATKVATSTHFQLTALKEPGYPSNVCLKRFYSHNVLSKNIEKYLKQRKKPDCIYCAIPSLDVAYVAAMYCKKNNIKFVVDIQDLWPEAFKMVFHVPLLSDLIFKPMENKANKIYKQADEIIAVSNTYCNRAKAVNRKVKQTHTIYLGTNMHDFDNNVKTYQYTDLKKKEDEIWLAYCGTLGHSYDLTVVFDALHDLKVQGIKAPKFIIMGDGPRREEFKAYANQLHIDCVFTGTLFYPMMCALLCECDITINPITSGAAQSIINKHADYAMSGLPVINTQECMEYRNLVDNYKMGFNCNNNDHQDVANKLAILVQDKSLRETMGKHARECAIENFDRKVTYDKLVKVIKDKHE